MRVSRTPAVFEHLDLLEWPLCQRFDWEILLDIPPLHLRQWWLLQDNGIKERYHSQPR